ncbi:MAG: acyltransferase [Myxococcaceae bacterium]|nr:acyltransferase [Myxococcaceae bacterium]
MARTSARYQSLDFWRGVACLLVVVYHATFHIQEAHRAFQETLTLPERVAQLVFTHGWVGVTLFFVISGYCITASAVGGSRRDQSLWAYVKRRVSRIYPPYWAVIVLFIVTEAVSPGPSELSVRQWIGNLTLTEQWLYHLGTDIRHWYVIVAWSLGYEEQFYILAGLCVLAGARRYFTAVTWVSLAVVVAAAAGRIWPIPIGGLFLDGRWLAFAAGIVVFWHVNEATPEQKRRTPWFLGLLFLLGLVLRLGPLNGPWPVYSWELAYAAVFAALLTALHRSDAAIHTGWLLRPIRACGTFSYSIYLIHFPIVDAISRALIARGVTTWAGTLAITLPLSLAASVLAGWVFHILVERHFLPKRDRSAPAPAKVAEAAG